MRGWLCTDPHTRGYAKSRISDMVNNGYVEPASPAPAARDSSSDDAATAPEPETRPEAEPGPEAEPARGTGRSPKDMVMSLAILIIPIALLLTFYRVVLSGDAPVVIDPAPTIQQAQQANAFPVLVPQGLSDEWHPSSATWTRRPEGATLRIGYVDPDDDPIQLIESSVPPATLLPAELTKDARQRSVFRAPNGVWRLYDGRPGEQALVLSDGLRTVIVIGNTEVQNLETMAGSLR